MTRKGIDVSYHQGAIDWKKVKKDDIEFVIIRAGYGKTQVDKRFVENICGAESAGLDIGIYWFLYAVDISEAIMNAKKCHDTIEKYKGVISMKVWADWEYDSDKKNPQTKNGRTEIVRAFCETLRSLGWEVGVYANPDYLENKFGDLSEYPLWLAKYSNDKGGYEPDMWQYSSKGTVDGIIGNVDMNILYGVRKEEYYEVPEFTLLESLNKIGVNTSFENRKKIAERNGISNYRGTVEQNIYMLDALKKGKLKKV